MERCMLQEQLPWLVCLCVLVCVVVVRQLERKILNEFFFYTLVVLIILIQRFRLTVDYVLPLITWLRCLT